jgi:lipopolysaccharide/colanic/teichoic acid biosynthesis glycosyltransferase
MIYTFFLKRFFDFITALFALIILFPFFCLILMFLIISNSGKPFFFQIRPGKNEKLFRVIKFKTMNDKKDSNGDFLPDSERITKTGNFIRKTSLDEIPQLINVLKGDMSLIGPRPLLVEYLELYNDNERLRHSVKPGITGWAQINGRNAISWKKKLELDVWYVNNLSFFLDLKIFLGTFKKVLKSEDISANNHVTMEKFNGKN